MYFLAQNEVEKLLKILSKSEFDVKKKYIDFLNSFQSVKHSYSEIPYIDFNNTAFGLGLQRAKVFSSEIKDIESVFFDDEEQKAISKNYFEGMSTIESVHTTLLNDINSVVNTVAFYKIPDLGGGSVTCFIGLIWLSPQKNWTPYTYAENMVHETIHQLLFLEDMVYQIFPNPDYFDDKDAVARSSILKIRRPFDKAFHSACVAAGIVYFYEKLGMSERVNEVMPHLKTTVTELLAANERMSKKRIPMLSDRGVKLLEFLNQMKTASSPRMLEGCL